ncbi:MAG: hypothetical protein DRG78_04615 [Epsilonproteobacteria bacterium]|nr:MAG: hypothetical protein DRG78_04615 [Campylobacterota bacterium]
MNIFIHENDEKDKVFEKLTDKLNTIKLKQEIKTVFKKAYNNYIGYYLFKDVDKFYKIFILPKNIPLPKEDGTEDNQTIKEFLNYLKEYYRLKSTYTEYQTSSLDIKSLIELSFKSLDNKNNAQDMEQFVFNKYKFIIQEIITFFNSHKSHKRIKSNYISQTIKYKINLSRNIKEIDKTKIHQEKYEDIIYSQIATVAYGAIKLFIRQKIDLVEDKKQRNELLQISIKLQNILLKKYKLDNSFNLSLAKLISSKIYKFFRKKQKYKILYTNILSLFGLEHFFDEENNQEIHRNITSESLFLRPELMYEWYVYDWILQNKDKAKEKFGIYPDEVYLRTENNKEKFYIKQGSVTISTRTSEPDIIIVNNDKKVIIDVKWKKLSSVEIKAKQIDRPKSLNMNDVLKLQRDKDVHNATELFLVFLELTNKIDGNKYQIEYNDKKQFGFTLIQVPII